MTTSPLMVEMLVRTFVRAGHRLLQIFACSYEYGRSIMITLDEAHHHAAC
ncbi:hypothetical protein NBRC103581_02135 [Gluconobacter wancherniae NBRC 103581]|nr:hypothetical protein NBRC103581_02135 [Gluconobacter wancherniae NBRC 103581]